GPPRLPARSAPSSRSCYESLPLRATATAACSVRSALHVWTDRAVDPGSGRKQGSGGGLRGVVVHGVAPSAEVAWEADLSAGGDLTAGRRRCSASGTRASGC